MKKRFLPLLAVAMTVTFTACQQTGDVEPVTTNAAVNTILTELIDNVRASGADLPNAREGVAKVTLTPAQVLAGFKDFDTDKNGQLSDVELFTGLNNYPYSVKVTTTHVQQLITMYDTNLNGFIEYSEFEVLVEEALKRRNAQFP
ncbi:EF-hand domain-containing protein [Spirosoma areae]